MPFIDPDYLLDETPKTQKILITCADDSNVTKVSFELAKMFHQMGNSVLWINGNLGENTLPNIPNSTELEAVFCGKLPLTHAIQNIEGLSVLTGISKHFLAELSETNQYQFLQDFKKLYPNFDKVVFTVDGKNPILQKKWIEETENTYLLFSTKNLFLNRTANWLNENKADGLIGIGKNDQEILLAYMRLKEILGEVPELILDIKKIAP